MPRQKSTHVDDAVAVGRRLRTARERAGLSQRALAFPGCTPAYISRIEVGSRVPSLQLLEELGTRLGVSSAYLARGVEDAPSVESWLAEAEIALRLGEVEEAHALYERALAGDARARSEAYEGLGEIALRRADPGQALLALEEAVRLDGRDVIARPGLAERLAHAYAELGRTETLIALLDRCVTEYERAGDRVLVARFACLLGCALADRAELGRAELVVTKAIEAASETSDPYTRARFLRARSRSLAQSGQAEAAEAYARQTLQLLRATQDTSAVANALHTLAHICLALGRARQAVTLLEQSEPLINAFASPAAAARHRSQLERALSAAGGSATRTDVGVPYRELARSLAADMLVH